VKWDPSDTSDQQIAGINFYGSPGRSLTVDSIEKYLLAPSGRPVGWRVRVDVLSVQHDRQAEFILLGFHFWVARN
jgi:hypothetical protein